MVALNAHEARVLGVLIEKAFTTPDQYPLSLNAATNGCNQKSNRHPVVDFSEAEVTVAMHEGVPLYIELPTSVVLEITYTEPGLQGDRSTGGTKPATVETGATVQVPLFISNGEKIKVDTRDGRYLGRA